LFRKTNNPKTMKTIVHSNFSLALILALLLAPVLSYAQTNNRGEASGLLDASVNLNEVSTDVRVEAEADAQIGTTSTTSNTGSETRTESSSNLNLNASGVAITSVAQVNSEADLEVFAQNLAVENENVEEVKTEMTAEGESQIEVTYRHSGRLLGMMPVTFKSVTLVTTVNNTVEAKTRLPWWTFMVTNKNEVEAEIESRIKDNATIMTSAEMEASASARAEIIRAVVAELNAHGSIETAVR
jgi:hypothetical protein